MMATKADTRAKKKPRGFTVYGDDIQWDVDLRNVYSDEARILFDIRRYMKVFVSLMCVFVAVIVVSFGLIWYKISEIQILKTSTLNAYNTQVAGIMTKGTTLMSYLVNVGSDVNVTTSALVASFMTGFNTTALQAPASAPMRHLLSLNASSSTENFADLAIPTEITSQTLGHQDYMFRRMVYTEVQKLLNTTETRVAAFDASSISNLLNFLVYGVNYTAIATRFDRTITDIENVGTFGTIATMMLGVAAQLANVSLPHLGMPSMLTATSAMAAQAAAAQGAAPR